MSLFPRPRRASRTWAARKRTGIGCALAAACWAASFGAEAQVDRRDVPLAAQPQQRFDSGQDVQPIYEGWRRSADGSIILHFGYLNRNYREQPAVPVGPDNRFSPGDPDRGQPTYFHPRTHRFQFSTPAPPGMGTAFEDGLVWTIRRNGSEQTATAWLQPEWEIDEDTIIKNTGLGFGRSKAEWRANRPPRLAVEAAQPAAAVGRPLVLTAVVEDDALPSALPPQTAAGGTGQAIVGVPALTPPAGAPAAPDNVVWRRRPRPARNGLSLLWVVYRGPAGAEIDPPDFQRAVPEREVEPAGTQARRYPSIGPRSAASTAVAGDGWTSATFEATVTFSRPGTYVLRAFASDAMRLTPADLTVTVTP